jgi:hypothetical protein
MTMHLEGPWLSTTGKKKVWHVSGVIVKQSGKNLHPSSVLETAQHNPADLPNPNVLLLYRVLDPKFHQAEKHRILKAVILVG